MQKYFITVGFNNTTHEAPEYKEIDGEPLIIKGFESLNLFIHHPIGEPKTWQISEATTGLALGDSGNNKEQLIDVVKNRILKLGLKYMINIIDDCAKKTKTPYGGNKSLNLPQDIEQVILKRISKNNMGFDEYVYKILRNALCRKHHK